MLLLFLIDKLFLAFKIMLFIRILGSWVPEWQSTRFMQFIGFYTDPYLNFFRKIIPPLGMMDFSPIIAFFALGFLEQAINSLIISFL